MKTIGFHVIQKPVNKYIFERYVICYFLFSNKKIDNAKSRNTVFNQLSLLSSSIYNKH